MEAVKEILNTIFDMMKDKMDILCCIRIPVEWIMNVGENLKQLCRVKLTKTSPDCLQHCKYQVCAITHIYSYQDLVETVSHFFPETEDSQHSADTPWLQQTLPTHRY